MKHACDIKRITINGFTLAELLIALAILGVIATFTIPKILDSGSDSKFNSIAKEAIGMISGAYQSYKLNSSASASTSFSDLTPYMNFVKLDSVTTIDDTYNNTTRNCSQANRMCLLLHNGAILFYVTGGGTYVNFGDTSSTSALQINLDPDGKVTSTGAAGTAGKALDFALYYNGRVVNRGALLANTYYGSGGPAGPNPAADPPWFSWGN